MVEDILKSNNLKVTKQRIAVLESITKLEDNATITNIINNCNIDKSTIYRILKILINNNALQKDINYDNKEYYKIKNIHKHYIKCVKCKNIIILNRCPVDNISVDNFKVLNHSLKIEGICYQCLKK